MDGILTIESYLGRWPDNSYSRPIKVLCDDGKSYSFKGRQNGKSLITEYVVGKLGEKIDAPVPISTRINLPDLICEAIKKNDPVYFQNLAAGIGFGNQIILNCGNKSTLNCNSCPENRERFAKLLILYSWCLAKDHQCIYQTVPPPLVYSVDHGHFFPGGPNWTSQTLSSNLSLQALDPWFNPCNFSKDEIKDAALSLENINDSDI